MINRKHALSKNHDKQEPRLDGEQLESLSDGLHVCFFSIVSNTISWTCIKTVSPGRDTGPSCSSLLVYGLSKAEADLER